MFCHPTFYSNHTKDALNPFTPPHFSVSSAAPVADWPAPPGYYRAFSNIIARYSIYKNTMQTNWVQTEDLLNLMGEKKDQDVVRKTESVENEIKNEQKLHEDLTL